MIGGFMPEPLRILNVGGSAPDLGLSPWGPFTIEDVGTLDAVLEVLRQSPPDAILVRSPDTDTLERLLRWAGLSQAVLEAALVVAAPEPAVGPALKLLQRGAQDVLNGSALGLETLGRRLRLAVERKRIEQAARKAYATDLATGLPNHAQLLEHMTHLLALREREPAPMAVIALRIEGLAGTEAALGAEAANVLRRKVAVRIRAGLRASDVVASLGSDSFAVLLAWIDSPGDAPRVATKLSQQVRLPFSVAGTDRAVAVSMGLASYPADGRDADGLLRRAIGQAASLATVGREGHANRIERGPAAAANDE
jgi:diguanylate cyclase (GGDEF)-like protein